MNVTDIAQQIAQHLGPAWTAAQHPQTQRITIERTSDNLTLRIYRLHATQLQILCEAAEGRTAQGQLTYFGDCPNTPQIGVSPRRKPEVIAKDIERRLLPTANEWWPKAQQDAAESIARWEAARQQIDTILNRYPDTRCGREANRYIHGKRWTCDVTGSITGITLLFPIATFEQVIALLDRFHQLQSNKE